ncbi:MAG TPA: hypothetical protein VHX17_06475 [Candidatus Cybelea sp.]|jgi:hypothetical protein|nr:hypothetical protein [Candidatus Cybelea sp.]
MAVNVQEYMTKFQEEGLEAIKQSQDASLKAIRSFGEFTKELSEKPGTMPTFENMPSPTQWVEMSFGFASQLLEIRKNYTMKIAEMIAESQKNLQAKVQSNVNAATPNSAQMPSSAQMPNSAPINKQPVK